MNGFVTQAEDALLSANNELESDSWTLTQLKHLAPRSVPEKMNERGHNLTRTQDHGTGQLKQRATLADSKQKDPESLWRISTLNSAKTLVQAHFPPMIFH